MPLLTPFLKEMFGQSPIRPLQAHMEKVHACTQTLLPFFIAVLAGDWGTAKQQHKLITDLEEEADNIKKDLRLHLPQNLFLPVPRSDLLEMLTLQDRIANKAKDIAGLVIGRKMIFPPDISSSYLSFLRRCLDAEQQAQKAIGELDELLETGFGGAEAKLVEEMIVELDRIEHATDELQIDIRTAIFHLEKDLPPVDVIFLYKIIEWTGDLADHAHAVGGQLQLLLAR
jgi:predicted phosphate transport protein (TIGR00153 family)